MYETIEELAIALNNIELEIENVFETICESSIDNEIMNRLENLFLKRKYLKETLNYFEN